MKVDKLTADRLREVLTYERDTGLFRWSVRTSGRIRINSIAGASDKDGYVVIRIDRVRYRASRLAWLYVHGKWPDGEMDHINHVRTDDRINNLRDVGRLENNQNVRYPRNNNKSTGVLGVAVEKSTGRFKASINVSGRKIHLGTFRCVDSAHEAYLVAKRKYHEGCTI